PGVEAIRDDPREDWANREPESRNRRRGGEGGRPALRRERVREPRRSSTPHRTECNAEARACEEKRPEVAGEALAERREGEKSRREERDASRTESVGEHGEGKRGDEGREAAGCKDRTGLDARKPELIGIRGCERDHGDPRQRLEKEEGVDREDCSAQLHALDAAGRAV